MSEAGPDEPLPTLELAAAEHLSDIAVTTTRNGEAVTVHTFGVARVGTDLADLVDEHGVVVAVRRRGGVRMSWQVEARLVIDVYARTYQTAWDAQGAIDAHLADRWQPSRSRLRIDSWKNDSAADEQPYPNGDLTVINSIWRVTSRHLPA